MSSALPMGSRDSVGPAGQAHGRAGPRSGAALGWGIGRVTAKTGGAGGPQMLEPRAGLSLTDPGPDWPTPARSAGRSAIGLGSELGSQIPAQPLAGCQRTGLAAEPPRGSLSKSTTNKDGSLADQTHPAMCQAHPRGSYPAARTARRGPVLGSAAVAPGPGAYPALRTSCSWGV